MTVLTDTAFPEGHDDDLPVDEAWLEEQGFVQPITSSCWCHREVPGDFIFISSGWKWVADVVDLADIHTRGDMRKIYEIVGYKPEKQ